MTYTLIPISTSKPIYRVQENSELFGKGGVSLEEERLQRIAANLGLAPKIHSVISNNGSNALLMYKIPGMSLADFYGEDQIPSSIWNTIRDILQKLWNHGIEYVDITPYNFMIEPDSGKIWVIDFGHAKSIPLNSHLSDVLTGLNKWNDEYR